MKPLSLCASLLLSLTTIHAAAQYVGPQGQAESVRTLLAQGQDDDSVRLTGFIVRRLLDDDDLYEFSDASGTIRIEIKERNWPAGLRVDAKTRVTIVGKYEREWFGPNQIKVLELYPAD